MSLALLTSLLHILVDHWVLVLFSLIALIPPAVYYYSIHNFNYWTKRGIPSPPAVPFVGSSFSMKVPFPTLYLNYVKDYGKVFGVFLGQRPQLVIADPVLIKRLLIRDFHCFRNRSASGASNRIFAKNIVVARNEEWKRIRSILNPVFTSSKLRQMEHLMGECVSSLLTWLDSIQDHSINARSPMGKFTLDVIAKCAFATETNAHTNQDNAFLDNVKSFFMFRKYRALAQKIVPKFAQQILIDFKVQPFHLEEFDFFENISRVLIQERRGLKGEQMRSDMLQLMVNAEYSEEQLKKTFEEDYAGGEELEKVQKEFKDIIGSKYLSEEEIMAQAMVFFLAGYETTASTLSYCLYELAINQEVQERLYIEIQQAKLEDPDLGYGTLSKLNYLGAVLSETLRKYPPVLILAREANEEYSIPELKLTIPKGGAILIPVHTVQNSEEYFADPEKFDPDRFMPGNLEKIRPYTYMPFGAGPRSCIGSRFAMVEAKLGLARLLDRFQVVRVEETTDKLKLLPGQALLKTSPIYIGVKRRSES